jgi:hypothetical protein
MTAGDLNGDGSADVAVIGDVVAPGGEFPGVRTQVVVVWGRARGGERPPGGPVSVRYEGPRFDAEHLFAGDLDGDGRADLVATAKQDQGGVKALDGNPSLLTITGVWSPTPSASGTVSPLYDDKGREGLISRGVHRAPVQAERAARGTKRNRPEDRIRR